MDMSARQVKPLFDTALLSLNDEIQYIVGRPFSPRDWARLQAIAGEYMSYALHGRIDINDITANIMRIGTYSLNVPIITPIPHILAHAIRPGGQPQVPQVLQVLQVNDNYQFWKEMKEAYQYACEKHINYSGRTPPTYVDPLELFGKVGFNALEANPPDMYAFHAITCILMSIGEKGEELEFLCSGILELENVPRDVKVDALAKYIDRECFLGWSEFWFQQGMFETPEFWRDLLIASDWQLPMETFHLICDRIGFSNSLANGQIFVVFLEYARDYINGFPFGIQELDDLMYRIITRGADSASSLRH